MSKNPELCLNVLKFDWDALLQKAWRSPEIQDLLGELKHLRHSIQDEFLVAWGSFSYQHWSWWVPSAPKMHEVWLYYTRLQEAFCDTLKMKVNEIMSTYQLLTNSSQASLCITLQWNYDSCNISQASCGGTFHRKTQVSFTFRTHEPYQLQTNYCN